MTMRPSEASKYLDDKSSNISDKEDPSREGLWIYTFTGKQFYAFDPREEDIDILDIAHALSLTCRYSGHCNTFYSVAQHSVLISEIVDRKFALAALLHDAPEAYLTDIPRPIKHMLNDYGVPFSEVEDKIYKVIAKKFDCQYPLPHEVNEIDYHIVADEAMVLFDKVPDWTAWYTSVNVDINPVPWYVAEKAFIERFNELTDGG